VGLHELQEGSDIKRLVLLFLVALAIPATAQAKEPIEISVCGESGCSAASNPIARHHDPFGGSGVGATQAPPPGPYYRLDLTSGDESWSIFYVPAARVLAIPDDRGWPDWLTMGGPGASVVRRLAQGVEPFNRPIVSEALLNSRPLPGDPTSYLALLEIDGRFDLPEGESVPLELRSDQPSPWTNIIYPYYPEDGVLLRATGSFVRLPPMLVSDLDSSLGAERREKAVPPSAMRSDQGGLPWLWLALGLALGLLAAAAAALLARRRAARGVRLA
jgi:hypothetical protein